MDLSDGLFGACLLSAAGMDECVIFSEGVGVRDFAYELVISE